MSLEALLRAAKDSPKDDLPRLALADWLDDHGDPARAEFIRLQLARANLEEGLHQAYGGVQVGDLPEVPPGRREAELLATHLARWTGWEGAPGKFPGVFHRGLLRILPQRRVGEVTGPFREGWVEGAAYKLDAAEEVGLALREAGQGRVAEVSLLGPVGLPGVRELVRAGQVPGLRQLRLEWLLSAEGAAVLAGWEGLRPLTRLALVRCRPGAEGLASLAGSPHLDGLTHLYLRLNALNDTACEAALERWRLPALRELVLREHQVTTHGVRLLAQAPALAGLEDLEVWAQAVRAEGVAALVRSPHLARLRRLALGLNMPQESPLALVTEMTLPALRVLEVGQTTFPLQAVRALAQAPWAARLHTLVLRQSYLGDEGAAALAQGCAAGLSALGLTRGSLTAEGAWALARSQALSGLVSLALDGNALGDEGAAALAESPHLIRLEHLLARECQIGMRGTLALADSPCLPALCVLAVESSAMRGTCLPWERAALRQALAPQRATLTASPARQLAGLCEGLSCPDAPGRRQGVSHLSLFLTTPDLPAEVVEQGVDALLGLLDDPDAEVRQLVVRQAGELRRHPSARPQPARVQLALARALRDIDPAVREAAADGLVADNLSQEALALLAGALADGRPAVRREVIHLVGDAEQQAQPLADALVPLLDDPDPEVRRSVPPALEDLNAPPEARRALAAHLNAEDAGLRRACALALLGLGDSSPVVLDLLCGWAGGADEDEALEVVRRVSSIDGMEEVRLPVLRAGLRSASPAVRAHSARGLEEFRTLCPREELRACLADPDPEVRVAGARAVAWLERSGPGEVLQLLRPLLADPSVEVRRRTLELLAWLRAAAAPLAQDVAGVGWSAGLGWQVVETLRAIGGAEALRAAEELLGRREGAGGDRSS